MGYREDERKLNIALLKIRIEDLHVVSVSYWHVETATPNKDSGLSNFLIDTDINVFTFQHCLQDSCVLLYLLKVGSVILQGEVALTVTCRNPACGTELRHLHSPEGRVAIQRDPDRLTGIS